jgi:hypothetical protein
MSEQSSTRINVANKLLNEARDLLEAEARGREGNVQELLEDAAEDIGNSLVALENVFGEPEWIREQPGDLEIAQFLQREKHRLPEKHREFVDDMVVHAERFKVTPKQHEYLHSLFGKLGGKIT